MMGGTKPIKGGEMMNNDFVEIHKLYDKVWKLEPYLCKTVRLFYYFSSTFH